MHPPPPQNYANTPQGQFFPFFVLTLSAIITVPLTYSLLKPSSDPGATAPRITSDFKSEHDDLVQNQRKKQKRRERKIKRFITVVVGWSIIGFMAYLIHVTARTLPKIWNPYDILGIKESATEKEIKSHYKRMSLKYHPDKVRADPAKNETIESLNDFFVEFTKAYKALTDEDIRHNFQQYGHPDGKQSFSIGIALPKIMVSEGNGKYVLIVYAGLLGVLLPYLVGKWWYGTQALSKEKVLIESANSLVPLYEEQMTQGDIITALSTGAEFRNILKGHNAEANLARIESRILAESDASTSSFAGGLTLKDRKKLEELDEGVRRKALALLWAYLGRVELNDRQLEELKVEVAPTAHLLTQAMIAITLAYGATTPIINAYAVAQSLIQAIAPNESPLLQLPYFTPAIAKTIEGDSKSHMTLSNIWPCQRPSGRSLPLVQVFSLRMSIRRPWMSRASFHIFKYQRRVPSSRLSARSTSLLALLCPSSSRLASFPLEARMSQKLPRRTWKILIQKRMTLMPFSAAPRSRISFLLPPRIPSSHLSHMHHSLHATTLQDGTYS